MRQQLTILVINNIIERILYKSNPFFQLHKRINQSHPMVSVLENNQSHHILLVHVISKSHSKSTVQVLYQTLHAQGHP